MKRKEKVSIIKIKQISKVILLEPQANYQRLKKDMETKDNGKLATEIYTIDTSSGEGLNFHGFAPQDYKTGVIRTLLNRAFKTCSDWSSTDKEIKRMKQVLTINNYPWLWWTGR